MTTAAQDLAALEAALQSSLAEAEARMGAWTTRRGAFDEDFKRLAAKVDSVRVLRLNAADEVHRLVDGIEAALAGQQGEQAALRAELDKDRDLLDADVAAVRRIMQRALDAYNALKRAGDGHDANDALAIHCADELYPPAAAHLRRMPGLLAAEDPDKPPPAAPAPARTKSVTFKLPLDDAGHGHGSAPAHDPAAGPEPTDAAAESGAAPFTVK